MLKPVPHSDCDRAREAASAALDGELSELESARFAAHLHVCSECAAFAGEIGALAARLRAEPLVQPRLSAITTRRRRPILHLRGVAAAVTIAVAAGSSFAVGNMLGSEKSRLTPTSATASEPTIALEVGQLLNTVLARPKLPTRAVSGQALPV
jgi:predicted anti-sigma-YlaC factor YlaD